MVIISVHIPKTAGSSFRKTLAAHLQDRLLLDYGDKPMTLPENARQQAALAKGSSIAERGLAKMNAFPKSPAIPSNRVC